ncbi:MAG: hypothetical protein WC441_05330, partial [Patescibacteria group bacterium]
ISDPIVSNMNETKWMFEYEVLRMKEERRAEEVGTMFKAIRKELLNILGLNLMPMEDSETGLLRRPDENEYIPLAVMTAREGFIEAFVQRNDDLKQQEEAAKDLEGEETLGVSESLSEEELDEFMKDEVIFLDDPVELQKYAVRSAPETKWLNENVVKPLAEEAKVKQEKEEAPMKISIQSEPVDERPVAKSKRRVTVSSE